MAASDLSFDPFERKLIQNPTTAEVVDWMRRFADHARLDPDIRHLAESIVQGLAQGDYVSEALGVYVWMAQNVRYVHDPDLAEYVRWPRETLGLDPKVSSLATPNETLQVRAGDCDDMATAIAGLMRSIGARCSFVLAAFTPAKIPSHVFTRVETPNGPLVLDPVANKTTGRMLATMTGYAVVPCDGRPLAGDVGMLSGPFQGWKGVQW